VSDPGVLEARGIEVDYAGVVALQGVDLRLEQSEILGLIGPNGAGKTTLVNVLTGFTRASRGSVCLDGQDVTPWRPHRIARAGVARTFQSVRLFEGMSVFENVAVGALGVGASRQAAARDAERLLSRASISELDAARRAAGLPHGQARVVGVLRALAARPRYLLLDEPAAGLNEAEGTELVAMLAAIPADFGCGVMIIEHDMRVIMRLCHRIHVLDYGRTLRVGTPTEVQSDPAVRTAYLGTRRGRADRTEG
jgi:branched-chain amino acid transport system ATP-binding protein